MKWGVLIALLAGLVAAIYLVWVIGFGPVFAAVARAGFGGLGLLCLASLVVTAMLSVALNKFLANFFDQLPSPPLFMLASVWIPPLVLAVLALLAVVAYLNPSWRARLRWRPRQGTCRQCRQPVLFS